ncbi:MAG: hypothetical protein IM613_05770 [Cytophagales bacterium]|jgi:hypothetical protein|nr:hypothetical protein [Cytophagales bacterium]MCA6389800.1 hypothetical protein [Cytophagales bacterium]MCA6410744.1 hypothetical protein [Cytophagales bacterium]MCA6426062.1 hypothetical protein [Cytophagales bacterium]MCA6428926.1 hypothetical protein [Cytophagales bacterium]
MKDTQPNPEQDVPSKQIPAPGRSFSILRLEERVTAIFSIMAKLFVISVLIVAAVFVARELSDSSYYIQNIEVPEAFQQAGFSGNTIATRISRKLNEIIQRASTVESAISYASASAKSDVSVDLIGVGVPIRGIIELIGNAVGIYRKNKITGEITIEGNTMVLELEVIGEKPERFEAPLDSSGNWGVPLKTLVTDAAETILKYTNDDVLNAYYGNALQNGEKVIRLSKFRLERYKGNREKEASVYAAWAQGLVHQKKLDEALVKVEEGLKYSTEEHRLYNVWANVLRGQKKFEESLAKRRLAFAKLKPTDSKKRRAVIMSGMASTMGSLGYGDSAIYYLDKAIEIDPDLSTAYYNQSLHYLRHKHDTTRFFELLETSLVKGIDAGFIYRDEDMKGMLSDQRMVALIRRFEE